MRRFGPCARAASAERRGASLRRSRHLTTRCLARKSLFSHHNPALPSPVFRISPFLAGRRRHHHATRAGEQVRSAPLILYEAHIVVMIGPVVATLYLCVSVRVCVPFKEISRHHGHGCVQSVECPLSLMAWRGVARSDPRGQCPPSNGLLPRNMSPAPPPRRRAPPPPRGPALRGLLLLPVII